MENSKTTKLVISVLRSDSRLIEHLHSHLDDVYVFVSNLETALNEENVKQNKSTNKSKTVKLNTYFSSTNPISVDFGNYNIKGNTNSDKESMHYLTKSYAKNKSSYKNFSRFGCNFSKWHEFVTKIELRISLAFEDLRKLKLIDQDKQTVNSKLEHMFY